MDPKLPIGTKYCLCKRCGEYFTNETSFSMHQRIDGKTAYCVHPMGVVTKTGKPRLRLNVRGYWARPGRHPESAGI